MDNGYKRTFDNNYNEIIDKAKEKAKNVTQDVIDYTESKGEDFLKKASTTVADYIDSK